MKEGLIIYDIEIRKAIPSHSDPIPDIEYCKGWHDFENMGIACICAYRYSDDSYHVFLEDNLGDFGLMLNDAKSIIGYNNFRFDDNLCATNLLVVRRTKSMDLLDAIWKAAEMKTPEARFQKGFGLDNMAFINLGQKKTLDGATAPIQWQRGYRGQVINYCMSDVWLTKLLIDKVLDTGELINPLDTKRFLRIELKYRDNLV